MSIQPPQRRSTKASIREFGPRVTEKFDSIKRRISSGFGHETQEKKRPRVIRRVSVMGQKAAEKVNDFVGRFSPRHSSSVEQSGQQYGYGENQYQPSPAAFEIPRNSTAHVVFANEAASGPAYCQDGTYLQGSQPQEDWSMAAIPGAQLDHNMVTSPSISTQPPGSFSWTPVQDTNMSTYPPSPWHQATTTREQLLGDHSRTPPPDPIIVEGPLRELNQFSASALRGTHKSRFNRTVNAANELGTLITGSQMDQSLSPTIHSSLSPIAASPIEPRRGSTSSESFIAGDDVGHQPCPWPSCGGTTKSHVFESNRLKEHIRRMHLLPFMCDTEGCTVRKGDKHQIYRHRTAKHPDEPEKRCKEQDQDPVALKKYKALNERGLSYSRIAAICKATTLEDLEEPWEKKARAEKTESPTTVRYGSPETSFMEYDVEPRLQEFVNTVLAPHVDALQLKNGGNKEEALGRMINRLMQLGQEELERIERRRSTVSTGQSYTDMITSAGDVPGLTGANTLTLTSRSVSQGSGGFRAFVGMQESSSDERFWSQQGKVEEGYLGQEYVWGAGM